MAHGYLHEGYGMWGDFDPDHEGRDRDRDRNWRDRDRDRGFMFEDRNRDRFRGARSDEREWFGGREPGGFGGRGDYDPGRRSFSSSQDDHYRSWRDRQMQSLDRDYADYRREREQQFHQDFDSWRDQRRGNPQPLQTGMTQSGLSADPTGRTQAEGTSSNPAENDQDAAAAATLGTSGGRNRR